MGYSMIEGKLVQVAYPEDAVELMEIIQKANDEVKFVRAAHAKELAWKPRGRKSPIMQEIAG